MRSFLSFLFFISSLFINENTGAQVLKEKEFKKACNKFIQCVSKKDLAGVNSLIDATQGVYVLYRTGAMDEYINLGKMEDEFPLKFEYYDLKESDLEKYSLKYGKAPVYDCDISQEDEDGWNKRGYYADTVKKYSPVSAVVFFRVKYMEEKISKKKLEAIRTMERNSRKVVFTGTAGDGIIFYLFFTGGKWKVSIIDRLTTDCSA